MRKVILFMMVTLDGFYEGPEHEIDWHVTDEEFNEFAEDQLDSVDILLFGRKTYELMASYWPTPAALRDDPKIARKMNGYPKIVFSTTLPDVAWQNTRLVKDNFVEEVLKLKGQPGRDTIIFGSSDLAVTFIRNGLLDECRIMVNPVVLGAGKSLFKGIDRKFHLKLLKSRTFRSGNVLLYYQPEKK